MPKPLKKPKPPPKYRLKDSLKASLLACINLALVPAQHQMAFTWHMSQVVHGTEPKVDGQPMWDCTSQAHVAYSSILSVMGRHMLYEGSWQGKRSVEKDIEQFQFPQTSGSTSNVHDMVCHMPARQVFPKGSPFTNDSMSNDKRKSCYTWVELGKDRDGKVVRQRAHVLIAAARYGVPDMLLGDCYAVNRKLTVVCHLPSCPKSKGGCCNPLHLTWGTAAQNKLDQGTLARNRLKGVQLASRKRLKLALDQHAASSSVVQPITRRVTRAQAKQAAP